MVYFTFSTLVLFTFLLLALGSVCLPFSSCFLWWKARLLNWDLFFFPIDFSYKFPSEHCFFCMPLVLVCCSYLFISKNFLIYLIISSLTYWLYRNMLFNFHIFVISQISLCNWFLILFYVVRKYTLYDFILFKLIEACFMA